MLATSASQYLHPDYLQPLPTTLDAKKSPLALLAQTCSNIGKDTAPAKPLIPPLEKKEGRGSAEKPESERPEKKEEKCPVPASPPTDKPKAASTPVSKPGSPLARSSSTHSTHRSPTPSTAAQDLDKAPLPVSKAPLASVPSTSAGHLAVDPHLFYSHVDPLYASALAAHAGLGLKPGEMPHLGSVSPYVAYAQVKAANGATTLVPICRDPYCTNCQLSMRGAQLGACAAGCAQCTHDKQPLSHHQLPLLPLGLPAAGLSSLYPSTYLTSAAPHGLPYVCNWVAGSEHCGKRFTTSEDLLRHLRTHTSTTEAATTLPSVLSAYSLSSALNPYHGHLPAPSLSPNSLHRAYPTSLSPISNALASNRYHPYKSSLSSLSSTGLPALPPSVPSIPFPSVGAYYSPYSVYGQRLGAAAVTP